MTVEFTTCEDYLVAEDDDIVLGTIQKSETDHAGYYVFNTTPGVELTCKHLRTIAQKVSDLNMS